MKYLILLVVLAAFFGCSSEAIDGEQKETREVVKDISLNDNVMDSMTYHFSTNSEFAFIQKFTVKKVVFEDHSFNISILCSDTSNQCNVRLNKVNGTWNIWSGQEWVTLFNQEKSRLNYVYLKYMETSILPIGRHLSNCDTLYSFRFKKENVDFTTDNSIYFFSPVNGNVAISNGNIKYFRDDYDCLNILDRISK